MNTVLKYMFLLVLAALSACVDQGDDKPKERVCAFIYPCSGSTIKVYAGEDQTVFSASIVQLQGGSNAWNSAGITYRWTQRSGPAVALATPDNPVTKFTAPTVASTTELKFRLTLRKNGKQTSDSVIVRVEPSSTAAAVFPQEVEPNDSQSLASVLPFSAEAVDVVAAIDSTSGDAVDYFAFTPSTSGDYRVLVCGSVSDCSHGMQSHKLYLTLYDQNQNMLAGTFPGQSSRQEMTQTMSAGVLYYLAVSDWDGTGSYRLLVSRD